MAWRGVARRGVTRHGVTRLWRGAARRGAAWLTRRGRRGGGCTFDDADRCNVSRSEGEAVAAQSIDKRVPDELDKALVLALAIGTPAYLLDNEVAVLLTTTLHSCATNGRW